MKQQTRTMTNRDAQLRAEGWDAAIARVLETDVIQIPENPYLKGSSITTALHEPVATLDLHHTTFRELIDLSEAHGVKTSQVVEIIEQHHLKNGTDKA